MEQLANIVERVNNTNLDSNVKLLEWSERKFQGKVNEKISSSIELSQVELATKIESVKKLLENIFSLYTKLCDTNLFIHKVHHHINNLVEDVKKTSIALPHSLA